VRNAVGVALAGGRSSRLGLDKAALLVEREGRERTLLEWTVRRLAEVCDEVVVAGGARDPAALHALLGPDLAVGYAPDAPAPAAGPAAGVLGAAALRPGRPLLALACDLPRVPVALLSRLAREREEQPRADWIVPASGGRLEPLCALYGPAALAALARRATAGRNALHELASERGLERRELPVEALPELDRIVEPLLNLNLREDLDRLRSIESAERTDPALPLPPRA
jgi:molybdopterin-guanine dinucleotide biosynthesis protein A